MKNIFAIFCLSAFVILSLSSCTPNTLQTETAKRTAMPVFMIPRIVPADNFTFQAFERIHGKNEAAVVYFEQDGASPFNPIATRLAAQDSANNVIVLARPCQYAGTYNGGDCPKKYLDTHRYSDEVIQAYNNALNNIKATYDLAGFHFVGFEGGAAIATLVAAGRMDVASIRTVAGKLDTEILDASGRPQMLDGSLNPRKYAQNIVTIPQLHFVGGKDKVITDLPARSYLQEVINAPCVKIMMIDNSSFEGNWVEQWGELLKMPVTCR